MFRRKVRRADMIGQHARERQMRPAKTEIHGRLFYLHHKISQIIACSQPRQNPVALPSPRDHFFLGHVRAQMPALFLRVFGNALVQTMIIPAHGQQDSLVAFWHDAKQYQLPGFFSTFRV